MQAAASDPASVPKTLTLADLGAKEVIRATCLPTPFQATGINLAIGRGGCGVGNKLAVHVSGSHVAYVRGFDVGKVDSATVRNDAKNIRKVEVLLLVSPISASRLCGFEMRSAVQDLDFAHIFFDIILGAIDSFGDVMLSRIEGQKIEIILDVSSGYVTPTRYHLIRWCPYVEDGNNTSEFIDPSRNRWSLKRNVLITNNTSAEIWNVDQMLEDFRGRISKEKLRGRFQTRCDDFPIVDVCVSPDGETFATLNENGDLKFYDLADAVVRGRSPKVLRTLHSDHAGSGCSFVTFMDDYTRQLVPEDELFWTKLVVGNGGVLTVYNAGTWQVEQRIQCFTDKSLKASKDPSGRHLFLSSLDSAESWVLKFDPDNNFDAAKTVTIDGYDVSHYVAFAQVRDDFNFQFIRLGGRSLDLCHAGSPRPADVLVAASHNRAQSPTGPPRNDIDLKHVRGKAQALSEISQERSATLDNHEQPDAESNSTTGRQDSDPPSLSSTFRAPSCGRQDRGVVPKSVKAAVDEIEAKIIPEEQPKESEAQSVKKTPRLPFKVPATLNSNIEVAQGSNQLFATEELNKLNRNIVVKIKNCIRKEFNKMRQRVQEKSLVSGELSSQCCCVASSFPRMSLMLSNIKADAEAGKLDVDCKVDKVKDMLVMDVQDIVLNALDLQPSPKSSELPDETSERYVA